VVRGGTELPTFRFSGRAYPKLALVVRALRAVAGRCWWPVAAAVAVTVAVSRVQGIGCAGVTRLCAWCENPIPAKARRDAVCCSVRGLAVGEHVHRRIAVSTRIRNQESAQAKVNDADSNPIEIAAVVVWQVADTASAIYFVDDYTQFVSIQTETAGRHIASSYPYTSRREGELSLRDNADEITSRLSAEIAARLALAGVHIIESRLTRLSYAPEIAQAMLRQQQASAVVGARQRIVEGAVGMVQLALQRLQDESVVDLDEERKATMVSNLLVVLCSEQATQPVVDTGTRCQ
jgi:hypothetical protein